MPFDDNPRDDEPMSKDELDDPLKHRFLPTCDKSHAGACWWCGMAQEEHNEKLSTAEAKP